MDRPGAEGLIEVPPGTPCGIVGADEVWAAGGRVFICPILPDPSTGEKYSTSAIERRLRAMTQIKWLECWDRLLKAVPTKTSWGRNELLQMMTEIERRVVREAEEEQDAIAGSD